MQPVYMNFIYLGNIMSFLYCNKSLRYINGSTTENRPTGIFKTCTRFCFTIYNQLYTDFRMFNINKLLQH